MKTQFSMILVLLLLSCGQPNSGDSTSNQAATTTTSQSSNTKDSQTVNVGAQLFLKESDLPDCEATNERELVYIKETGHFEYCDNFQWVVIDIKGPQGVAGQDGKDGKDGKDGAQGAQGIAGTNGSNGTNGTSGTNGIDGQDGSIEVWRHPVNRSEWFLGHSFGYSALVFGASKPQFCPAGSRLPTAAEYQDAMLAGAWNQFSGTINGDSGADTRIIIDETGNQFSYSLILGASDGSFATYTQSDLTLSKHAYPLCIVE